MNLATCLPVSLCAVMRWRVHALQASLSVTMCSRLWTLAWTARRVTARVRHKKCFDLGDLDTPIHLLPDNRWAEIRQEPIRLCVDMLMDTR